MSLTVSATLIAGILLPLSAEAQIPSPSISADHRRVDVRGSLELLERGTDQFKETLAGALDTSALNGSPLEDRLNQWANLLEDEVDFARDEFRQVGGSQSMPDSPGVERFGDHWSNVMMAGTAINRAMIRRGFAPNAETQWAEIRTLLNRLSRSFGRPPLPDMSVIIFRPPSASTLSRAEVKTIMTALETSSSLFEDKIAHAWFVLGAEQRRILERWSDDFRTATHALREKYREMDVPEYFFRLEESLMLASGLNRVLLLTVSPAIPHADWERLLQHLNALAGQFGFPLVPKHLRA